MNIVLVTVDSLRADHMSLYGYERETTPNIDDLASTSHVFTDAVSHACATRPSFPSILTSTQGLLYGGFERLDDKQVPLAVPLSEAGYSTGGFHSNPYLSGEFGYDRGFDTYSDSESDPTLTSQLRRFIANSFSGPIHNIFSWLHAKTEEHAGIDVGSYYQNATDLTDEALEWAEAVEDPFFLWVHYMDPHHPYLPPEEHQVFGDTLSRQQGVQLRQRVKNNPDDLSEQEWSQLKNLYDAEIRYVDHEISRLLDELDEATWLLTADHGEEFYEHGNFGHKHRFYEEHVHVPMVFNREGDSGTHEHLVGLVDGPVTLLEEADVPVPENYRGQHVLKGDRERVIGGWAPDLGNKLDRARLMSRSSNEKYIRDFDDDSAQLYNLINDPEETINLANEVAASGHEDAFDDFLEEARLTADDTEHVQINEDLEQQLRNLGYKE